MTKEPPRKTIYRLSIYQRCLSRLRANSVDTVSSEALAKAAGVKPTQLRKDLAYFGQFGTRGIGYSVSMLSNFLDDVLGTTKLQPVILIGVGNLGAALLRYDGFRKEGFEITAAFDLAPESANARNVPFAIRAAKEMPVYVREHHVKMAILAIPSNSAQSVVNEAVDAGIQAILNFSPTVLQVPSHVIVNSVDLAVELENLSYFIR
ncbi:MAG: redox-sensing transcriptional repressor [Verrucomicrobia bacterium]|nr:MAG: redox-sensing transcriptional repressor [Verrucomicrobiota bacterium]